MAKQKRKSVTMHSFFEKKARVDASVQNNLWANPHLVDEQEPAVVVEEIATSTPPQVQREGGNDDASVLIVERDPGLRRQIWDYPTNAQEQARNAYMKHGAYQIEMDEYPLDDSVVHQRKFQYHWFKSFPWLEYSPWKDAVYCFPTRI
ncbi:hypothetical protein VPH35_048452 [Triticum aestivum]